MPICFSSGKQHFMPVTCKTCFIIWGKKSGCRKFNCIKNEKFHSFRILSLLLEVGVYNLIRGSLFFDSPVSVATRTYDGKQNMNLPCCKLLHWCPYCCLYRKKSKMNMLLDWLSMRPFAPMVHISCKLGQIQKSLSKEDKLEHREHKQWGGAKFFVESNWNFSGKN